ncbi:MAG: hypothetical protein KME64_00805 [Scytonematopsis contorta HA4267-MV1]|jgi:cell division protein FtsB|nr:hypothetical protein [Scytonematopsis contorta HA4267-MV1]
MDAQFSSISPSTINQAVINLAIRYQAILKPISIYYNDTPYRNASQQFQCIEIINSLQNIGKSIEIGSGKETWEEYYKFLNAFINGLAKTKLLSIDAIKEMIATEVKNIQAEIAAKQQRIVEEQKQIELYTRLIIYIIGGTICLLVVGWIGSSIWGIVSRKVTNEQKVEQVVAENNQLQQENQALKAENQTLKQEAESFKKFQQERNKLSAIQAENAELKSQNKSLNDRIYQCKKGGWFSKCE